MSHLNATPPTTQTSQIIVTATAATIARGTAPTEFVPQYNPITDAAGMSWDAGTNLDSLLVIDYISVALTAGTATGISYEVKLGNLAPLVPSLFKICGDLPASGHDFVYLPFYRGLPFKAFSGNLMTTAIGSATGATQAIYNSNGVSAAFAGLPYQIVLSGIATAEVFIGSHLEHPSVRRN